MGILDILFPCDDEETALEMGPLLSCESDGGLRLLLSCGGYARVTGEEAQRRLVGLGFRISDEAKFILNREYIPCRKDSALLSVVRSSSQHEATKMAESHGLKESTVALACILREMAFDYQVRDMGLETLVVRHRPVLDSDGCPCHLALYCGSESGDGWLDVYYGHPDGSVGPKTGFVFSVP